MTATEAAAVTLSTRLNKPAQMAPDYHHDPRFRANMTGAQPCDTHPLASRESKIRACTHDGIYIGCARGTAEEKAALAHAVESLGDEINKYLGLNGAFGEVSLQVEFKDGRVSVANVQRMVSIKPQPQVGADAQQHGAARRRTAATVA